MVFQEHDRRFTAVVSEVLRDRLPHRHRQRVTGIDVIQPQRLREQVRGGGSTRPAAGHAIDQHRVGVDHVGRAERVVDGRLDRRPPAGPRRHRRQQQILDQCFPRVTVGRRGDGVKLGEPMTINRHERRRFQPRHHRAGRFDPEPVTVLGR